MTLCEDLGGLCQKTFPATRSKTMGKTVMTGIAAPDDGALARANPPYCSLTVSLLTLSSMEGNERHIHAK